ncbi:MAG: MFS transporter [Promethearchaeota archaeon]
MEQGKLREKKGLFTISLILFVTIVALLYSVQNLIPPLLDSMVDYFELEGQKTPLGIVTGLSTLTSGFTMVMFGYLSDKTTRVKMLFIGTISYSVPSILTTIVPPGASGLNLFFVLQLIIGFGFGVVIPNIFSLMGDIVPKKNRSKGFSFFSIASLLGTAVGQAIGSAYAASAWQPGFVILGVIGIVGACLTLLLKEPNRIGRDNLFLVQKDAVEYTYRINRKDFKEIFKKKSNIWLIVNFVDTIPTGIILFLLYSYLEEVHNVPADIGIVFLGIVLISTLVGTIVFGFITDRRFAKGKRKARVLFALMANVIPVPFVFIGLVVPFWLPDNSNAGDLLTNPGAIIVLLMFSTGLFLNGATNGSWYATVVDINLPEHRGTVLSTANFFDIIGRSIGPFIGALIADAFGTLVGMTSSIIFWVFIPLFWVPVLKHVITDMDSTEAIFQSRLSRISGKISHPGDESDSGE